MSIHKLSLRWIASVLVASGCMAHGTSGNGGASRPVAARILAEVPLTFQAGGRTLPVPLVEVEVNGTPTLFIVDSGSSHNVITRDFAAANHIATTDVAPGRDHAGASVNASAVSELSLRIGSFTRRLTDAVMVPGPPPFTKLGIGGFLSPQNVIDHGFVVMDFPAQKLFIISR